MNSLAQLIAERRSCRKFTDEAISAEDIKQLKRAALSSPTSKNCKSWEFVFVQDKATIEALSKSLGATWVQLRGRGFADGRKAQDIVRGLVGTPEGVEVLAIVAVGHPAESHRPYSDDRLPWDQVHDEKF